MDIRTIAVGPLQANCYILGQQSALVVDPGDQAQRILDLVSQHNITVSGILLTHSHFDHISALKELVQCTGALVYIHHLDFDGLSDNFKNLSAPFGKPLEPMTAEVLLNDGDIVPCDGQNLRILHTPGHTPGSICVYCDQGFLISGDTLFENSWGRTDFPGGNPEDMQRSLERLDREIQSGTKILPGHGRIYIKE